MILFVSCSLLGPGPLGLYEEIDDARPRARDSCTSYATENIDYLTEAGRTQPCTVLCLGTVPVVGYN